MTDQRFKYYTGYEVDNEPSDDECVENTKNDDHAQSSGSSDDEFDKPIREFIEKNMSRSKITAPPPASTAFANEMEDELDTIYHTFLSRGTFELPLSTQKSKTKTVEKEQQDEEKSDEDDQPAPPEKLTATTTADNDDDDDEDKNDDLLYDPQEEEEDEKWMNKMRIKSRGGGEQKLDPSSLSNTDAVLNCPGCMVLICHDCQRHETNRNQYRAMFVFHCAVDESRTARVSTIGDDQSARQKKKKHNNKRLKTKDDHNDETLPENEGEVLRPVLCTECGTELGAYEPKEELYHFAHVLASH